MSDASFKRGASERSQAGTSKSGVMLDGGLWREMSRSSEIAWARVLLTVGRIDPCCRKEVCSEKRDCLGLASEVETRLGKVLQEEERCSAEILSGQKR